MNIDRVNILGVGISAINMDQALKTIETWIIRREQHYVCVTPVHAIMDFRRDHLLMKIANNSGLTTPDGMPVVWLLKLKGYKHVDRVYGPDLMFALCEKLLPLRSRHYFYGGAPGIPERLANRLKKRFPSLQVAGTYSPPFRQLTQKENLRVIKMINETNPDILWVGISTPKQERFMADHISELNTQVLIGVGAAFDFLSGNKRQAPRWMQQSGLEWIFRLYTEPRRLARRYLINNPLFIILSLAQLLKIKEFTLE
jgi:N-acetylglucosaminyldiphosphoundecaprenol N-acetyl-beta-D-mannosaminyltransferase